MHALAVSLIIAIGYALAGATAALPMLYEDEIAPATYDDNALKLDHLRALIEHLGGGSGANGGDSGGSSHEASDHLGAEKREPKRYGFGLGRRSAGYTYTSSGSSGVKRLPVYNFGLGKRSDERATGRPDQQSFEIRRMPYSFGLGKRSAPAMWASDPAIGLAEDDYHEISDADLMRMAAMYRQQPIRNDFDVSPKRSRPFDFGLGKRLAMLDAMQRRSAPQRYNFGLGR